MNAPTLPQLGHEAAQSLRSRGLPKHAAAVERLVADNIRMHAALTEASETADKTWADENADRQYALEHIDQIVKAAIA